jgi:FAD:protein FMN transferase
MKTGISIILFILVLNVHSQLYEYSEELILMGSRFELTAVAEQKISAEKAVKLAIEEIRRIESDISEYIPSSTVSKINDMSGISPVKVSKELYDLIERSLRIAKLTNGAFDITWAGMSGLWSFDGLEMKMPSDGSIAERLLLIGYSNISLNKEDTTVFLKIPGMKIGFGANGKGFAANKAASLMKELNIPGGIVNAGGDLITWGKPLTGEHWTIGVSDPENTRLSLAWLNVDEMAVVTSGNYEKYTIIEGKKFSHIIDPRTGYPVSGLKSVTIICPDAELADALATAVFVMGRENGLNMINQLNGIECLIIDDNNKIHSSDGLQLNYYQVKMEHHNHTITIGQK